MPLASWLQPGEQEWEGRTTCKKTCVTFVNQNDNYFFGNKIIHNFKIGFNDVKHFLNQTYILPVFIEKASKMILF